MSEFGDAEKPISQRWHEWRQAGLSAEYATGRHERTEARAARRMVIRVGTIAAGSVVLAGGLAMLVLPGPGAVGVLAGLGILSRELPWAERVMSTLRRKTKIDQLADQPRWVQATMWTVTAVAVAGSVAVIALT